MAVKLETRGGGPRSKGLDIGAGMSRLSTKIGQAVESIRGLMRPGVNGREVAQGVIYRETDDKGKVTFERRFKSFKQLRTAEGLVASGYDEEDFAGSKLEADPYGGEVVAVAAGGHIYTYRKKG